MKIFWTIIVILIAIGGFFVLKNKTPEKGVSEQNTPNSVTDTPKINGVEIEAESVMMEDGTLEVMESVIVTYTDSGFQPKTVNIKKGQDVIFLNQSNKPMWVASDDHPSHTIYREFDQKTSVAKGQSWSFTFDKFGSWEYHNHREALDTGTIIVE